MRIPAMWLAASIASTSIVPAQVAGHSPAETRGDFGVIEGRVIDGSTGTGLPGVGVVVFSSSLPSLQVSTDSKGQFRFERVPRRRLGLTIAPGAGYFADEMVVSFRPGEKAVRAEVAASRTAVLAGRVLDRDRQPVPRAAVSVLQARSSVLARVLPARVGVGRTDELGHFRIPGVRAGNYIVLCEPPARVARPVIPNGLGQPLAAPVLANVPTFYPSSSLEDAAARVTVSAGQTIEGLELTLATEETVCIRSKVVSPDRGNSVVKVQAPWYFGTATVAKGEGAFAGGFEICGLPAGEFRLVASSHENETGAAYFSAPFSLTNRSARLPDILLQPLTSVLGSLRVIANKGSGRVPEFKSPALVILTPVGRPPFRDELGTFASVLGEGSFRIPAVLPDEYTVDIRAPLGFYVQSATVSGVDVMSSPFRPLPGSILEILLGSDGPSLSVQVTDSEGRPTSAIVVLGKSPFPTASSSQDLLAVPTADDGVAEFIGIAPGSYRLVAHKNLSATDALSPVRFRANEMEGESVTLKLKENHSLRMKIAAK